MRCETRSHARTGAAQGLLQWQDHRPGRLGDVGRHQPPPLQVPVSRGAQGSCLAQTSHRVQRCGACQLSTRLPSSAGGSPATLPASEITDRELAAKPDPCQPACSSPLPALGARPTAAGVVCARKAATACSLPRSVRPAVLSSGMSAAGTTCACAGVQRRSRTGSSFGGGLAASMQMWPAWQSRTNKY